MKIKLNNKVHSIVFLRQHPELNHQHVRTVFDSFLFKFNVSLCILKLYIFLRHLHLHPHHQHQAQQIFALIVI